MSVLGEYVMHYSAEWLSKLNKTKCQAQLQAWNRLLHGLIRVPTYTASAMKESWFSFLWIGDEKLDISIDFSWKINEFSDCLAAP